MEKIIIIHPDCISGDLKWDERFPFLTPKEKDAAVLAKTLIDQVIVESGKVVVLDDLIGDADKKASTYLLEFEDTSNIKRIVEPGDKIILMGAYREVCIKNAAKHAKESGAKSVKVVRKATIPAF